MITMWPACERVSHCFRSTGYAPIVRWVSSSSSSKAKQDGGNQYPSTRSKWTEEELDQLRKLWEEGKSYSQIHLQVLKNHPVGSIQKKIIQLFGTSNGRESQWSLNQSRITDDVKRDILTLHKNGSSVEAISRQLARSIHSIYYILRKAHLQPNNVPSRPTMPFTKVELDMLTSWANRQVFTHEFAATFPDRSSRSVRRRLFQIRQELGVALRPKYKKWSSAEDARLLALARADRPGNVSAEQFSKDIATAMGRSLHSIRNRISHLLRQKRLKGSATQGGYF